MPVVLCQRTKEACLAIAAGRLVNLPHQEPAHKLELDFDLRVVQKVVEGCGLGQAHWMTFGWAGDGRCWAEVAQRSEAEVHESFHSSGYEEQMHSVSPKEREKKRKKLH